MQWGHFNFVFLYLFVLFLSFLLLLSSLWRKRAQLTLAEPALLKKILNGSSPFLRGGKAFLKIFALCFIILALMEPKWGTREEEVTMRGIDLMILVDVSNSMLAKDVPPSRMERAKRKFHDLLDLLAGDRVGLVAFAGRSFLLSPLTIDYGSLAFYVDELDPSTIPVQGTDLAGAIQLALETMPKDNNPKAILIFTDGEDHSEQMEKMIKILQEKNVRVFIMGVGSLEGAPVPDPEGGFKSTPEGNPVVSKLAEGFLKDLAVQTGGAYIRTVTSEQDLKELYIKGIRGFSNAQELKETHKKIWESRFYWPLGMALVLLMFERLLPGARKVSKEKTLE